MPAVLRRGVMDELATAASAVAIATDAFAEKDSELGLTFTTCLDVEAQEAAEERINVDKENDISIPAEREVEAGNPKIARLCCSRKPMACFPRARKLREPWLRTARHGRREGQRAPSERQGRDHRALEGLASATGRRACRLP